MDLEELRAAASKGEILKDSALRRVWRAQLAGHPVVLKEVRIRGALERLRAIWLRSRTRVEFQRLRRARKLGLPCPEPLASIIEPGISPREACLVLEDLGPGQSVDQLVHELLSAHKEQAAKQVLARCGQLIAKAFDVGLVHRDLHLGNLWCRASGELFLLDLHRTSIRSRSVTPRRRLLRGLYLALPWPAQASLREALFTPLRMPATPRQLESWRQRQLARRLRRALRPSGDFRRVDRIGEPWALARRGLPGEPSSWRANLAAGRELKAGRRGRVVWSHEYRDSEETSATRDYVGKSRLEAQSLAAWLGAEALQLRQLPHARAMACFAAYDEGCGQAAGPYRWILSEALHGPALGEPQTLASGAALAAQLGRFLARLHGTGWRCRDPRGDNFRLRGGRLQLVDLDGIAPIRPGHQEACACADLGRLLAWLRFQAPLDGPLQAARRRRLELRALAAWRREIRSLSPHSKLARRGSRAKSRIAAKIELRCAEWQARHETSRQQSPAPSVRAAPGSASGDAPWQSQ